MSKSRVAIKRMLARAPDRGDAAGVTILIYHRVGGAARDELDVALPDFEEQMQVLSEYPVASIGEGVDQIKAGRRDQRIVLTFDDGFGDVYENAWPILRDHRIPFTIYVASAFIDGVMGWPGSTAKEVGVRALTWRHLEEMLATGLCTLGSHTHTHARPELLTESELDKCSEAISRRLGVIPEHFAYTWGQPVPEMDTALRERFRSAATGTLGRNLPGHDLMLLSRVPVRGSDPIEFFEAKLTGGLVAERLYSATVATAKRVGVRA